MQMTRQFIAILLLACFGMLIPTMASPVRVCFLESEVYLGSFESFGVTTGDDGSTKAKCCPDCGDEEHGGDPCCVEIHKLPDAPEPSAPFGVQPVLPVELKDYSVHVERPVDCVTDVFSAAEPIRGPTSGSIRRALLGIWNI